jgi:hypothetical protein
MTRYGIHLDDASGLLPVACLKTCFSPQLSVVARIHSTTAGRTRKPISCLCTALPFKVSSVQMTAMPKHQRRPSLSHRHTQGAPHLGRHCKEASGGGFQACYSSYRLILEV